MAKKIIVSTLAVFLSFNVVLAAVNYEELGEQWMDVMMGERHEEADQVIEERMGADFLQQMHENMGKMVASNQSGYPTMNMMGSNWGYSSTGWGSGWGTLFSILFFIFWIGLLALIYLGVARLWQLIRRERKKNLEELKEKYLKQK